MLKVENLDVSYGDTQVIWDVSFEVKQGEKVALIGPNGTGKTTLLKTIMGILKPAKGKISFLGEDLAPISGHDRPKQGLILIPEGRRLFPKMTVRENLEISIRTREAAEKKSETIEWVFELFPKLLERKNQLAGTLSGGEQQMLAIGRGIMARPKILMLDEPSLGLAPIIVEHVFDVINELNKRGITVFLVEQFVEQTLLLADRAYLCEEGRIVLEDTAVNMLNNEHVKKIYLGLY